MLCEGIYLHTLVVVAVFAEKHPKVVTAHQVKMNELGHFTTNLWGKKDSNIYFIHTHTHTHTYVCIYVCVF